MDQNISTRTETKFFVCSYCDASYTLEHNLQRHLVVHKDEKFMCRFCTRKFISKTGWKLHMEIHQDGKFMCIYCNLKFPRVQQLTSHISVHTDKKFVCFYCNRKFSSEQNRDLHVKSHDENITKPFICSYCNSRFAKRCHLTLHVKTHAKGEWSSRIVIKKQEPSHIKALSFTCSCCKSKFTSRSDLESHIKNVHPEVKIVACEYCDRIFFRLVHLGRHMQVTHKFRDSKLIRRKYLHRPVKKSLGGKNEPFQCPHCDRTYNHKVTMYCHIKTTHGETRSWFPCSHCGRKYANEKTLLRHIEIHHRERKASFIEENSLTGSEVDIKHHFMCSCCDRTFTSKDDLMRHVTNEEKKVHVQNTSDGEMMAEDPKLPDINPPTIKQIFPCPYCDLTHKEKNQLELHIMKIHESEKGSLLCTLCEQTFSCQSELKYHILNHPKLSCFPCPYCDKSFSLKLSVISHVLTHDENQFL